MDHEQDWQDTPLLRAAALEGVANNRAYDRQARLSAAIAVLNLLSGHVAKLATMCECPMPVLTPAQLVEAIARDAARQLPDRLAAALTAIRRYHRCISEWESDHE